MLQFRSGNGAKCMLFMQACSAHNKKLKRLLLLFICYLVNVGNKGNKEGTENINLTT